MTAATTAMEIPEALKTAVRAAQQVCVLLVEDNEDQMMLVKCMLEESGKGRYELAWASNLKKAFERLSIGDIDVVLLDLGLPETSGLASFKTLKEVAPDVPVIVLTADEREQMEAMVIEDGADDYLTKQDVTDAQLLRAIRKTVKRQKQHKSAARRREEAKPIATILGFVGAKGGVGTTSTVLNLAAALGEQGRRSIALEASSYQSGFALQLKSDARVDYPPPSPPSDPEQFARSVVHTSFGAGVVFGPLAREVGPERAPDHVTRVIRMAATQTETLLIDIGAERSEVALAAMSECDAIVLVVDREPTSIAAGQDWVKWFHQCGGLDRYLNLLIVNRSGLTSNASVEQVCASFPFPILGLVPSAGDRMAWALEQHAPLVHLDPEDLTSESILGIARYLVTENAASAHQ